MKWSLLSKSSGFEFDQTIADILAVPAKGEDVLLDRVRKAGGDEEAQYAAAAFARVREAIPADVLKAIAPKTESVVIEKSAEERERIAADARRTNERIQKFAKENTVTKPTRTTDEVLASVEIIRKDIEVREDSHAWERLEEAGRKIRVADHSLTKHQAIAKAMKIDPDLAAAAHRHEARQSGALNDDPREIQKAQDADAILEEAGAALRRADPKLTKAQAIAAALRLDPSLYHGGN